MATPSSAPDAQITLRPAFIRRADAGARYVLTGGISLSFLLSQSLRVPQ